MMKNISPFASEFVIDGIAKEFTPLELLSACLPEGIDYQAYTAHSEAQPTVDETVDPPLSALTFDASSIGIYLEEVCGATGTDAFDVLFPAQFTRLEMESQLIDTIWRDGHFRLGDISLSMDWQWNSKPIGNMAALYASAEAAAEFCDQLGITLSSFGCSRSRDGECRLKMESTLKRSTSLEEEDLLEALPYHSGHPRLKKARKAGASASCDASSWLIYIPFDSSEYHLGSSALALCRNHRGAAVPPVDDADYFIDCYEVVRELVEDGIVKAGTTVGREGLLPALTRFTQGSCGSLIDLQDLSDASGEKDPVRLLFSAVPGAVVQIEDCDYDYVDAELLLQDVAFYPLGRPAHGFEGIRLKDTNKSPIQNILEALIRSQSSEGED